MTAPIMTSFNIIRDILLGRHTVFHSDLPSLKRSLELHAIPTSGMSLTQCRRVLLHHIAAGACADHAVDVSVNPRPDRSACRALCQDFGCTAEMSKAVSNIVLNADYKLMSTESLSHLNISVPGVRNLRFKLRAALKTYSANIASTTPDISSKSMKSVFDIQFCHSTSNTFETALPVRLQLPDDSTPAPQSSTNPN
jgi:hypothetical protein